MRKTALHPVPERSSQPFALWSLDRPFRSLRKAFRQERANDLPEEIFVLAVADEAMVRLFERQLNQPVIQKRLPQLARRLG